MGYNISETGGLSSGGGMAGVDTWTFDIDLAGGGATTVSGDFDAIPISGGGAGEAAGGYSFSSLSTTAFGTLDFDTTTGAFTFTVDRAAVLQSGSDQVVSFTVTGYNGSGASDQDTVYINLLVCVTRGTMIDTDRGPVPVERLAPGDRVHTLDSRSQPVRWIGSRSVTRRDLLADASLRPIRIAAGALGAGRPVRDLVVSPQHRVLISDRRAQLLFGEAEVLVPAKALVNGSTICVERRLRPVEYFHILFERHEIIFTEGAATESFYPAAYALQELGSEIREELFTRFPELEEEGSLGPTARMALRPWEGALLRGSMLSEPPGPEIRRVAS